MAMTVDACKSSLVGKSGGSYSLRAHGDGRKASKVADATLPRKSSKENNWEPYLKPTQVDEENIQRRS